MNMRITLLRVVAVLFLAGLVQSAKAQQDPYYSHFKFVKQAYNPATVGEKDEYICASALAHNQWVGFDDQTYVDRASGDVLPDQNISENVAPVTFNFNIGGQIYSQKRKRGLGAVGFSVFDDRIGYMKTTSFKGQGAFFVPIQGNFARLALGVDVGFVQFGYVDPNFRFREPGDPRIPQGGINDMRFDLGFGAYYTQSRLGSNIKDFYAGLSLSHLNGSTFVISNGQGSATESRYTLAQHIYANVGGRIPIGSGANELEPAVLIKYNSKPQIDLTLTVLNNSTFRGGLGYRQWGTFDAITVLLGYVSGQMQFGYSYDITTSKIQSVSNGTHEIFASYCFQFKQGSPPPKIYKKSAREL